MLYEVITPDHFRASRAVAGTGRALLVLVGSRGPGGDDGQRSGSGSHREDDGDGCERRNGRPRRTGAPHTVRIRPDRAGRGLV